jgi:hypothetical protein
VASALGDVGDIGVGIALGSAVELGSARGPRTAVTGSLGSMIDVRVGLTQAITMAATSSPPMDRRTIRHMRMGAA